ncbi:hypothetical protein GW17_00053361 [Ensete ventricosum]|nr:hypothetical protein GW17_00053361 [Ensete ventricosum]
MGTHRSSPKVSGVRREFAEGDQELARKTSGVRRKKIKRNVKRSSGVAEKLVGRFGLHLKEIGSGHR